MKDRESLEWLCVTGIPPEKGDAWDDGVLPNLSPPNGC